MREPIPHDATEVIYESSARGFASVVKVAKHTATTVTLEGMTKRFRRHDGRQKGDHASYAMGWIFPVTEERLDRIKARELAEAIRVKERELHDAARRQLQRRIEALGVKYIERSSKSVQAEGYLAELDMLLTKYGEP